MSDIEKIRDLALQFAKTPLGAVWDDFCAAVTALVAERDEARQSDAESPALYRSARDRADALQTERDTLRTGADDWLAANGPGGWIDTLRAENAGLRERLTALLFYTERNTCQHDETHRGGAIWTICDACGMKWSDDRNPFKGYVEPAEIANARLALVAIPAAPASAPVRPDEPAQFDAAAWIDEALSLAMAYRKASTASVNAPSLALLDHLKTAGMYWRAFAFPRDKKGAPAQGERANPATDAPIARLTYNERGDIIKAVSYAPTLPAGEHDVWCVRVVQGERAGEREAFEASVLEFTGRDMAYHATYGTTGIEHAWQAFQAGAAWQARASVAPEAPLSEEFLPLLVRDLANEIGRPTLDVCEAIRNLGFGNYSVNMAVGATLVRKVHEHFAAQPEAPAPAPSREPTGPTLSDDDAAADLADAPRPGAAQYRARLTDAEAMRVVINACDSLNITRAHEIRGKTRTICAEAGLLEIARAVESAVLAQPDRLAGWRFERDGQDILIARDASLSYRARTGSVSAAGEWLHALASALIGDGK